MSLVATHHKNGEKSLFWKWPASGTRKLYLDLALKGQTRDNTKELQNGGIKFWLYHPDKSVQSRMNIIFTGKDTANQPKSSHTTAVQLDFKGWRAVWIGYDEFPSDSTDPSNLKNQFQLTELETIEFEITTNTADSLYIDLIQFMKNIGKQSRDLVVPVVGTNFADRKPYYAEKDFWQRSLRWHQEGEATDLLDVVANKAGKKHDIQTITNRIENWYLSTDESVKSLEEYIKASTDGYDFQEAKQKRWETLSEDITNAHTYYATIDFPNKRPPLFPKVSDYGNENVERGDDSQTKFGFIFHKILLPLSLELNFMSRTAQKDSLKDAYCTDWQDSETVVDKDHISARKFAGENLALRQKFEAIVSEERLKQGGLVCDEVIRRLNEERFAKIKKLLEYLEDQGWAEGSGLGSIDHEMNKDGSGFMHSMFLLRHELKNPANAALRDRLLKTMKWYNDFNEIYQADNDYIYDGTTADRIRTIFLYRLFIIIIDDDDENKQINNMEYFKTWGKHALRINKALGGLIKPDYTGFHHKTFYGVAYVPHALHNAALIQYFLEGTNFALPEETTSNIRKSLEVMRMVSVKYSTPNGLCGRFPSYNRAILAEHVPAYAYISYKHGATATEDEAYKPAMFLRLFTPSQNGNSPLDTYLTDGNIKSGIYYWNTIGSLDVLKNVKTLPCQEECSAESSPQGHWSKNFATLSIQRRREWSVAVKGMGKYTWDYESSLKENVLGMFGSHGSLQISNSEDALEAYDVTNGWDWRKIPGTTTIEVPFDKMRLKKARNYNYRGKFAGGVTLIGNADDLKLANGAFGMLFKQPKYRPYEKGSNPLKKSELKFYKSYFFYNDLIVCLGSGIKLGSRSTLANAQTTLFQDKIYGSKTIYVGTTEKTANFKEEITSGSSTLKDTNGNLYKVNIGNNKLIVQISDQTSKTSKGCTDTTGKFALAYLSHENAKTSRKNYEYAIVVSGGDRDLLDKYTVIQKNSKAHVIKIEQSPNSQEKTYGYAVFKETPPTSPLSSRGVLRTVSARCMIMIEKKATTMNLAISDPVISFKNDPEMRGKKTCTDIDRGNSQSGTLEPKTSEEVGSQLMYCKEARRKVIKVKFRSPFTRIVKVKVDGVEELSTSDHVVADSTMTELEFKNLKNGFTTEVQLEI